MSRRVFILGAGFSASAGLPLAKKLSQCCLQELQAREQYAYKGLLSVMTQLFPGTSWTRQDLPDMETFLDMLIAHEDLLGKDQKLFDFKRIRIWSTMGLCFSLLPTIGSWDTSAIENFVKRLRPGDAVLTFNWDLLLEKALYGYHKAENILYCPQDYDEAISAQKITFIKLHGSLDWLNLKDGYQPASDPEAQNAWEKVSPQILKSKNFIEFTSATVQVPAFIIPPTSRKTYDHEDVRDFWRTGLKAILESSEIWIIGYRFPEADLHARALVRFGVFNNHSGQEVKVNFISPDENAYENLCAKIIPGFASIYHRVPFEKHAFAQPET